VYIIIGWLYTDKIDIFICVHILTSEGMYSYKSNQICGEEVNCLPKDVQKSNRFLRPNLAHYCKKCHYWSFEPKNTSCNLYYLIELESPKVKCMWGLSNRDCSGKLRMFLFLWVMTPDNPEPQWIDRVFCILTPAPLTKCFKNWMSML
jgi:hypothetical protein